MLVTKEVQVEKEVDDMMTQLVTVVSSLKAGQSVTEVALAELLKLQGLVADFQALSGDYAESLSGTLAAVMCNSAVLAAALLGKK